MAAALFTSCAGHVIIHDSQWCSPFPGDIGADCNNFLTENPEVFTEAGWLALQQEWILSGNAIECTTSKTFSDLKAAVEELCTIVPCDEGLKEKMSSSLKKIQMLGRFQIN